MTSQAHKHSTTDAMSTTNELIISISNPGSKCGKDKIICFPTLIYYVFTLYSQAQKMSNNNWFPYNPSSVLGNFYCSKTWHSPDHSTVNNGSFLAWR
jgi:hypothetical protein